MGIPGYFSHIVRKYRNVIKPIEELNKAIDNLYSKQQLHNKLDEELEILYSVHRLILFTIHTNIYSKLTIEDKVEIFKEYLNKTYPFDNDDVRGGSSFIRAYNEIIKE